jgi:hypothetical protein
LNLRSTNTAPCWPTGTTTHSESPTYILLFCFRPMDLVVPMKTTLAPEILSMANIFGALIQ